MSRWTRRPVAGHLVLAAGLAALPAAGVLAQTDFAQVVPANVTAAGVIPNYPEFETALQATAYGKLLADPASKPLLDYVTAQIEQNQPGFTQGTATLEEFRTILTGGLAIYVVPNREGATDPEEFTLVAMIETDQEGERWLKDQIEKNTATFINPVRESSDTAGTTVYTIKGQLPAGSHSENAVHYATLNNVFVMALGTDAEPARVAVNRLMGRGTGEAFKDRGDVRQYTTSVPTGNNSAMFYLDSDTLIRNAVAEGAPPPNISNALPNTGLYDFEAVFLTFAADGADLVTDFGIKTPAQRRGIVKSLEAAGPTPLAMMDMVPSDALGATSFSFDMGAFYTALMEIVGSVSPEAAGFSTFYIASLQQTTGVDVINGILRNITGEHLVVQRPLDPEIRAAESQTGGLFTSSTAVYLGLKNGDETAATIRTMLDNLKADPAMADSFQLEEIGGVTVIRSDMLGMSAMKPALAFNNRAILFANNDVQLADSIRALNGTVTNPLTSTEGYRNALASIDRSGLHVFTFTPAEALNYSMEQVDDFIESGGLAMAGLGDIDPEILPDAEVFTKYFDDSWSTVSFEEGMIRSTARVQGK